MPRINANNLSTERRNELAAILIACGYTVRLVNEKKSSSGTALNRFVEYEDGQVTKV